MHAALRSLDQDERGGAAFLRGAAEPHLEDRKETGFRVIIFLILFAGLVYIAKRSVWSDVKH